MEKRKKKIFPNTCTIRSYELLLLLIVGTDRNETIPLSNHQNVFVQKNNRNYLQILYFLSFRFNNLINLNVKLYH